MKRYLDENSPRRHMHMHLHRQEAPQQRMAGQAIPALGEMLGNIFAGRKPNAGDVGGVLASIVGANINPKLNPMIGPGLAGNTGFGMSTPPINEIPRPFGHGGRTHGFGDFDSDGWYKGDLPGGGPITDAEKERYGSNKWF